MAAAAAPSAAAAPTDEAGAASSSAPPLHNLQNHWTMWYYTPRRQPGRADATWEEGLVQVHTSKSVEEFWAVLNTIKKPSTMEQGAVYSFFKAGIKPMWEDPANKGGGKWTVSITQPADLYRLDTIWEELLMSCVGEYLDETPTGNDVTGVMLAKKRNLAKISVWTKGRDDLAVARRLGDRLRDVMAIAAEGGTVLEFLAHRVEAHDPLLKL